VRQDLTARDFEGLVGVPWLNHGRTRAGADCWGLFRLAYAEVMGIELPAYSGAYTTAFDRVNIMRLVAGKPDYWVKVEEPVIGDGVVMYIGPRCHIGVVMGGGRMLHIEQGAGAVIESYESLKYSRLLEGFYRYNEAA
jgi:cell wall-associated NlpC family hydrolase